MMIQRDDLIPTIYNLYKSYNAEVDSQLNLFQIDIAHNLMQDDFLDWKGIWLPSNNNLYLHKATVNPGAHAIQNHEGGAAKVKSGWYPNVWVMDIHAKDNPNFAHEAFCQRPEFNTQPITIYRLDRHGNTTAIIESSNDFGINRHRASVQSDVTKVGLYGAACSVSQNHTDHETELAYAKQTDKYKANPKCLWSMLQIGGEEVRDGNNQIVF